MGEQKLNPEALEDLYKALKELAEFDEMGGNGKDHWVLVRDAKQALSKAVS